MVPIDTSPRVSFWEGLQTALLVLVLTVSTVGLGGNAPGFRLASYTLTCALVVVYLGSVAISRCTSGRTHPAGWLLLPFLIYAGANVWWVTPVPWLGWQDWLGWAQMIAVFWVVLNGTRSPASRRILFFTLVALAILGVFLACYQRFVQPDWMMFGRRTSMTFHGRASGVFAIPNSFAGFILLLLPAAGVQLFRRSASATERTWWGWVAAVLVFGLGLTISRGAWMALASSLVAWPLVWARGGWWRRCRFAVLMVVVLGVAGTVVYWNSPRIRQRFTALVLDSGEVTRPVMWRVAWQLFRDDPIVGTGGGSYNVTFERHRPERFRDEPLWAHNEYLNTLSDYGALGFALFFGAVAAIAWSGVRRMAREEDKPRRRDWIESPTTLAGLGVGLCAFLLQAALDFHFKIPALALAFAVVAGLAVVRAWPMSNMETALGVRPRLIFGCLGVASTIGFALVVAPAVWAESCRRQGRGNIDRLVSLAPNQPDYKRHLMAARTLLERATALDPNNGLAWSERSYATSLWAHVAPEERQSLGVRAEVEAGRALAVAPICSEFWVRRGVARDMQGRWEEASKDFAKAVALAPADAYAWYYYAEHFSRVPAAREASEAALGFCLRLDPGNPAGLALRQRLAINPNRHH